MPSITIADNNFDKQYWRGIVCEAYNVLSDRIDLSINVPEHIMVCLEEELNELNNLVELLNSSYTTLTFSSEEIALIFKWKGASNKNLK